MDDELAAEIKKELPIWECLLSHREKKPNTVGDLKDLTCRGTDFVEPGENYKIVLEYEYENMLRILKVKEDSSSYKSFEVTSYRPVKGDLVIEVEKDGELVFKSLVKGLDTESIAKTSEEKEDSKEVPPLMGYYVLPSTYDLIFVLAFILSILGIIGLRFFKRLRTQKEFKRIVSQAKYTDPFMDFNIEMRDFTAQKKPSALFLMQFEESLKKVFYRFFKESVSLQTMPSLVRRLKGLGFEPHEIRSFYVLDEEYRKFQQNYKSEDLNFYEAKKAFIDQTKKTINMLKHYSLEDDT